MDPLRIQTAQNVDLAFATAGLGDRILAWAIDAVITTAYFLALSFARRFLPGMGWYVVLLVPLLAYHLLFELFWDGRSPGKRARHLRVARLDGAAPTAGQYMLRWLLRWVDVTLSSGFVALLAIVFTKHGQRLGDLAAGTTVLKVARPVDLIDVYYPRVGKGYTPRFPEAAKLSDADVRTLRAVLLRLRRDPKALSAQTLAERAQAAVAQRLGVKTRGLDPDTFLNAIVTDYTAAHDRDSA